MDSSFVSVGNDNIIAYGSLMEENNSSSGSEGSDTSEVRIIPSRKTLFFVFVTFAISYISLVFQMCYSFLTKEREYCSCKGKCFRKKGKGACKCRMNGLICHESCSCNKAICKNQVK